jgi:hypothetical protein
LPYLGVGWGKKLLKLTQLEKSLVVYKGVKKFIDVFWYYLISKLSR